MNKSFFIALLAAIMVWQCDTATEDNSPSLPAVADVEKVAEMNQALGWRLFHEEQQAQPGENILLSPYSVQTALFMAQNGAQGSTLAQMLDLMDGADYAVADLNTAHKALNKLLTQAGGHPEVTVANRYFYDGERINVEQAFLNQLNDYYAAPAESLDFRQEDQSLSTINNWVSESTNGKIPKILDQITSEDVAFLINALYFKADWLAGFPEELTIESAFTRPDGSTVEVPFVNQDATFLFAQADGLQMVDLPFKDSTYSLTLLQPDPEQPEAQWPASLTKDRWLAMYDEVQQSRAIVQFPKLKLDYRNDLVRALKNMGMEAAVSPAQADFQNMGQSTNGQNIFIKQIAHQTVLEIDERGAEGAAVTSIGFATTSAPPLFRFNQPFVLVLRHIETNTMLFTGYVADPSAE